MNLRGPTLDNPPLSTRDRYGTIVTPAGVRVPLTGDDVLWTARMLEGEAGTYEEQQAIVWTLAQRLAWGSGRVANAGLARQFASPGGWTRWLQGFSQAINPAWLAGGSRCPQPVPGTDCDPARLRRRAALATKPWANIDLSARQVALAFAAGTLANNAPGVVNFRANDAAVVGLPAASLPFPVTNRYFYSLDSASQRWAGAGLAVQPPRDESTIGQFVLSLVPGGSDLAGRVIQ